MADRMPEISNRQERSPVLGFIARALRGADEFARKPFGYENPPLEILSDVMQVPALYRTIENINYGSPLTRGAGQARRMTEDTQGALEAIANLAPGAPVVLRGAKAGAKAIAPTVARQAVNVAERYGVSPVMTVVKPKGGNWLAGSVENVIEPLKRGSEDVANTWIDKKLASYLRNEMATPEDPVRLALEAFPAKKAEMLAAKDAQISKAVADMERARAERGFTPEMMTSSQARIRQLQAERALIEARTGLHYEPDLIYSSSPAERYILRAREVAGMPLEDFGLSDAARLWERQADYAIEPTKVGKKVHIARQYNKKVEPWMEKLDPESPVFETRYQAFSLGQGPGFSHLVDEMRNALNPSSGLPKELLIDPSKLQKMTLPQMVERVDQINAWRAVQKAEADAARAANAATVMHREYETIPGTGLPNERGLRWVELKKAEGADDAALEDALKYEGEVMGHCVGGYCPDVVEGRSRIFSLRDARGKPHATIEVRPPRDAYPVSGEAFVMLPQEKKDLYRAITAEWRKRNPDDPDVWKALAEAGIQPSPPSISQIKGYRNRAPDEDVLPFVQDFVRSGKWSDVGEIENAGLVPLAKDSDLGSRMQAAGVDVPPYVTQQQLTDFLDRYGRTSLPSAPEGFAAGGAVSSIGAQHDQMSENSLLEYDPLEVDLIADQFEEAMNG